MDILDEVRGLEGGGGLGVADQANCLVSDLVREELW